ncbi:LamG-like jellyroll fold domain-containing protein [uncultured Hymenobacter sp.]|uniref:LamG-like jellyroll fold domain-containing protein n=1 Tax=uncultured Hymenobacter sp. TaxID=170016 RepID=UPI0035CAAC89
MMLITNPQRFAGQGDTAASYNGFEQQYWEFYHAALDTSRLPTLEALRASIGQRVQQGTVPLLMLRYDYNALAATAAQDRLITIDSTNERVYDGPDLSRSPYTSGQFFSVVLSAPTTETTMSVYVGAEFWLGNQPNPGYISLDFGDGLGYRQVTMGSTVQVQVVPPAPGGTSLRGTSGVTTQTVYAYEPTTGKMARTGVHYLNAASTPPHVALGLVGAHWSTFRPTKGINGPDGRPSAIAWIRYASSNSTRKLRRPLVFVEGIDFERKRNGPFAYFPDNRYITQTGPIPLSDFDGSNYLRLGGYRNGAAGWNEMVDYNEEYKSLEKFPVLRAQLQASATQTFPDGTPGGDYDVIYLDFSDGASLIQHNAMVLVELLNWINKPENRTANAEETMVIGTSMGGQVARFALAWMEQQNLCHNSKLYVSFDSPHRGANIPLGIQYMFERLQHVWIGDGSAENAVKNKLKREAAMQMVNFHFSNLAPGYRRDWQAWQNSPNSYPSLLRKVAVANGSGQAVLQPNMQPKMLMLRSAEGFLNKTQAIAGRNYAYALPGADAGGKSNVVFRYQRPYSSNWNYSYADPNWSHFDSSPGSTSRVAGDADDDGNSLVAGHPTNTFMPTISALDVKDAGTFDRPNFGYDVRRNISPEAPNRAKYAFDAYFAAGGINEPHVQITNAQASRPGNTNYSTNNAAWIQNELRESAHLLPAVLSTSYNFGSRYRQYLPSVRIANQGVLYVNNGTLPASGGTAATQTAPTAGRFEMYTSSCGSQVVVAQGGQLVLGQPGNTHTAEVRMSSKGLLDVQLGGQVVVAAGSTLRLQRGATLLVRNGSSLKVDGQVIVEDGAFLCLERGANLSFSPSSALTIQQVRPIAESAYNPGNLNCSDEVSVCGQFTTASTAYRNVSRNEALQFDGNDVVSVPNTNSQVNTSLTQTFAVEAYIRADNLSATNDLSIGRAQTIFSSRHTTPSGGTDGLLFTLHGSRLLLQLNRQNYVDDANRLPDDKGCHHVAVTRDNTGRVRFYIDGQETAYSPTTTISAQSAGILNLGADNYPGSYTEHFQGLLGEVRVWNVWRSAEQIRQNSTSKLTTPQAGLVVYYDMQDGTTSSRLSDLSGISTAAGGAVPGVLGARVEAGSDDPTWVSQCALTCTAQGNFRMGPLVLTPGDSTAGPLSKYPKPKAKDSDKSITALSVSPNPATGSATLHFEQTQAASVRVWVQDLMGAERAAVLKETPLAVGPQNLTLPIQQLQPGLYLVMIESRGEREHIRLEIK